MADTLSRLEIIDDIDYNLSDTHNLDTFYADLFDLSDTDIVNPITYKNIMVNQQKDKTLPRKTWLFGSAENYLYPQ